MLASLTKQFVSICRPMVLLLGLSFVGACTPTPPRVPFTSQWPTSAGDYQDTTKAWTRREILRAPFSQQSSQLLEVHATFLSTPWRAAFVERQSELQKLGDAGNKELRLEQQKRADSGHEFQISAATYHHEHNDFHRENSMWRVVLVNEKGEEFPASSIERDRRSRQVVRADFPHHGDFADAYLVKFPKAEILSGGAFSLRISSSLGTIDLDWQAE